MSLFSVRLGIILLGLGIFFLGLYLQRKNIQGFQSGSGIPTVPTIVSTGSGVVNTTPSAAIPAVSSISTSFVPPTPPPIPGLTNSTVSTPSTIPASTDGNEIALKDNEIRNKMNIISINKNAKDSSLSKQLDKDNMTKLNTLYNEVDIYKKTIVDPPALFAIYTNANTLQLNTLRQMVYTIHEQVNLLYKIYVVLPSNVIATDTVISSDSALPTDIVNDDITIETIAEITQLLMGMPTPSKKLQMYTDGLLQQTKVLVANPSSTDQINTFNGAFTHFKRIATLQKETYTTSITNLTQTAMTTLSTPSSNNNRTALTSAYTDKINFITQIIQTITAVSGQIATIPVASLNANLNTIISSIKGSIDSYTSELNSTKSILSNLPIAPDTTSAPSSGTMEGFASYMNPYNQTSPSISQAYEFRLEKKSYADEVFSAIKLW